MNEKEKFRLLEHYRRVALRRELNKNNKPNHRHNFKGGKKVRIWGATHHIYCTIEGCKEFKVV